MINYDINTKFVFLEKMITMVIDKITPSLIITGEGGLGKTFNVKQTLKKNDLIENEDYIFFSGTSTPRGLYDILYDNNGKLIIFDDCDDILTDKKSLNILKAALDSYDVREVSWLSKMRKGDEYPNKFEFTGHIIFISNMNKEDINKKDKGFLTRAMVIDLSMTTDDKIERMEYILPNILPEYDHNIKIEALSFLRCHKDNFDLNMRALITVAKIRKRYPNDWRGLSEFLVNS